jgi:hypothetical protein
MNNTPEKDWREELKLHCQEKRVIDATITSHVADYTYDYKGWKYEDLVVFISHVESTAYTKGQREAYAKVTKDIDHLINNPIGNDLGILRGWIRKEVIDLSTNN